MPFQRLSADAVVGRDLGQLSTRYGVSNFRYIWPAECDLMAELAEMELEERLADWDGSSFTSDSDSHISIWRKC